MYRSEQVICHGRTDGARRVAVAVRVLPYIPPPCERDPIGALTHEGPYRPPPLTVDTTVFEMWLGRLSTHQGLSIPVV